MSHSKKISRKDISDIHFQKNQILCSFLHPEIFCTIVSESENFWKEQNIIKKLAISTSTGRDNVILLLRSCLILKPEDIFSLYQLEI